MPYYCTVPRCTSMAGKAKNVSFHQFPRDEELAKLWNNILKRGKPYTKYSKVCSLHFKPEDYTITSVGKNKGQWRTLRKDAIPSQNLPSESPTPYHRKQWSCWSATPSVDTNLQQQMAQAIYMQTMLAMQAAGSTDIPTLPTEGTPNTPTHQDAPHSSSETPNQNAPTSYKCTDCSKCFKDPDVFILHKRTHKKIEKENFNTNTLKSNPILANLLKTNSETNIFDNSMSMENLLMTALAANLDYIRKMSMIKTETSDFDNQFGDNHNGVTPNNHDGLTPENHNGYSLPNGFSSHNHNANFSNNELESDHNKFSSHNHNEFSSDNGYSSNNGLENDQNKFSLHNHNEYSPNNGQLSDNHNFNEVVSHNENSPPIINDRTQNTETKNYTENHENTENFDRYRIDVTCTDFQVHEKGFLDLRNKKNDSSAKNDRFAKNDSCDNDELNESFDSNNLVIDENI